MDSKISIDHYKSSNECMFEPLKIIINDYSKKKSTRIESIKNKLIDAYLKLKMPQTTLVLKRDLGSVTNWSVFSLINWYCKKQSVAEAIIQTPIGEKNDKIDFEIKQTKYKLNEFDMFLIFKEYKIPVIIVMKNGGSLLNKTVKVFDTTSSTDKEVYVIIYTTGMVKKSDFLSMAKINKIYKIPKSILNDNILSGVNDVNLYLKTSLRILEEKKEKKIIQDRLAQQKKRDMVKKKKKIGKTTLPSE